MKSKVSIDKAINLLNEALKLDRAAITNLLRARVCCNSKLAKHPTILVMRDNKRRKDRIGVLGIINGLFETSDGYGPITALIDNKEIITFCRTSYLPLDSKTKTLIKKSKAFVDLPIYPNTKTLIKKAKRKL